MNYTALTTEWAHDSLPALTTHSVQYQTANHLGLTFGNTHCTV